MRLTLLCLAFLLTLPVSAQDTDRDGLSDTLEQSLLDQFAPTFLVGRNDCSNLPAAFVADLRNPTVAIENGTIYGQVFPKNREATEVEIHFYHLWRRDCGEHGHPLDTEHVATLLRKQPSGEWKAAYWYAAAHEQTVCDVSQLARASTLHAEDKGTTVWISPGKHASYLNEILCRSGCGADRCIEMHPLAHATIINLGESNHPMNGSSFVASSDWPLRDKMDKSNFSAEPIARLEALPVSDIAWFSPGKHPVQGIIRHSATTENAIAGSSTSTTRAISLANAKTSVALDTAQTSTGNALQQSARKTWRALSSAAKKTTQTLDPSHGLRPSNETPR
jgi:hypothetical protein